MAAKLDAIAARLFAGVMAPLVLGGSMRPGHAIGARAALALGELCPPTADAGLEAQISRARVARARTLVAIDDLGPPTAAEWRLAAALHDIVQSANPNFATPLRRNAAARILKLAESTIDGVEAPPNVHDALSRHSWFARVLDIARTDTAVSWWIGSHAFLGVDPPDRLQAWPKLRRVKVARASNPLMDLAPLAVNRTRLAEVIAKLLACTPLTDLATCTRTAPRFEWGEATLAMVATQAGQTLAARALGRLPTAEVDGALGRATREAIVTQPGLAQAAVDLLANRAIARAQGHLVAAVTPSSSHRGHTQADGATPDPALAGFTPDEALSFAADAAFGRALGALAAVRSLASPDSPWLEADRHKLIAALEPIVRAAPAPFGTLQRAAAQPVTFQRDGKAV